MLFYELSLVALLVSSIAFTLSFVKLVNKEMWQQLRRKNTEHTVVDQRLYVHFVPVSARDYLRRTSTLIRKQQ